MHSSSQKHPKQIRQQIWTPQQMVIERRSITFSRSIEYNSNLCSSTCILHYTEVCEVISSISPLSGFFFRQISGMTQSDIFLNRSVILSRVLWVPFKPPFLLKQTTKCCLSVIWQLDMIRCPHQSDLISISYVLDGRF